MAVVSRAELAERCRHIHADGRRLVFTNGCFDILHRGHVEYLEAARALGDCLVVAVNSDASVRRLKGPSRPLVMESDRAAVIAALRAVDLVTIFDEDTPLQIIDLVRPDVLVKGGDYDPSADDGPRYIVGSREVIQRGGSVVVVPLVPGRSTTELIERMSTSSDS